MKVKHSLLRRPSIAKGSNIIWALVVGNIFICSTIQKADAQQNSSNCDNGVAAANLPGVVLDPSHQRLFTTDPDGRLIAIRVTDGALTSRGAVRSPLALVGKRLLTWMRTSDGLNFELLNNDGDTSNPAGNLNIALPWWASPDTQFTFKTREDRCTLSVQWRADRRYSGGAKPDPGIPGTESYQASGWISVKPGDVRPQETEETKRPDEAPATSAPYRQGFEWRRAPLLADGQNVFLSRHNADGGEELSLTYPDSKGDRRVDVAAGTDLFAMATPDSRHLFVTDLGGLHGAFQPWTAIEVATGRTLGNVRLPADVLAADLKGGIVYYLQDKTSHAADRPQMQQRVLAALDSVSGRELWERVVAEEQQKLRPPSPPPPR